MESISRRTALRIAGGTATAGAVVAPSLAAPGARAALEPGPYARYRTNPTGMHRVIARGTPLIGMSSPADVWDRRVGEVGPGLTARRIFGDLSQGAQSQLRLVEETHRAGMLPVISFKVGGDVRGAVAGDWNDVARRAARELARFRRPTAVTFWHEPHGDMTPDQYVAASRQLLPHFKRGRLRVGPILNGWLLDRQEDLFAQYCRDPLLDLCDWVGIDTYESGTMQNPDDAKPADRVRALRRHLRSRGRGGMPIGVGEYNGWSGGTIREAGRALLVTSNVWFGCVWNSTGGQGRVLEGARLGAFRDTLADPRSMSPS